MCFHVTATSFYVAAARAKAFNKEFMETPPVVALLEEHKKATCQASFPKNGYPDMGTGRLAALLPYSSYICLANAQRAHQNYVESFGTVTTLALISGLKYPVPTAAAVAVYIIGRIIFAHQYVTNGADARYTGAPLTAVPVIGMLVGAVATAGSLAKLW